MCALISGRQERSAVGLSLTTLSLLERRPADFAETDPLMTALVNDRTGKCLDVAGRHRRKVRRTAHNSDHVGPVNPGFAGHLRCGFP